MKIKKVNKKSYKNDLYRSNNQKTINKINLVKENLIIKINLKKMKMKMKKNNLNHNRNYSMSYNYHVNNIFLRIIFTLTKKPKNYTVLRVLFNKISILNKLTPSNVWKMPYLKLSTISRKWSIKSKWPRICWKIDKVILKSERIVVRPNLTPLSRNLSFPSMNCTILLKIIKIGFYRSFLKDLNNY